MQEIFCVSVIFPPYLGLMSRFSEALAAVMALEETNQAALAERAEISQASISRVLQNERDPSPELVGRLCAAVSSDRARRLDVFLAYLRDQAAAVSEFAGIDDRHFVLSPVGDEPSDSGSSLGAELKLLGDEAAKHEDMREVIVDMAA